MGHTKSFLHIFPLIHTPMGRQEPLCGAVYFTHQLTLTRLQQAISSTSDFLVFYDAIASFYFLYTSRSNGGHLSYSVSIDKFSARTEKSTSQHRAVPSFKKNTTEAIDIVPFCGLQIISKVHFHRPQHSEIPLPLQMEQAHIETHVHIPCTHTHPHTLQLNHFSPQELDVYQRHISS